MADQDRQNESSEKGYIEILNEVQETMPELVLPSMGMLNNELEVKIDGGEFFVKKDE